MRVIVAFWKHAMIEAIIVLKTIKAEDGDGLYMPSDLIVFGWQWVRMQMKVIVTFCKNAMTEDIVIFEM